MTQQREEKAAQCAQAAQHSRLAEPEEPDTGIKRMHILGLLTGDHGKSGGTDGRCRPMTMRTREDKSWLSRCQWKVEDSVEPETPSHQCLGAVVPTLPLHKN